MSNELNNLLLYHLNDWNRMCILERIVNLPEIIVCVPISEELVVSHVNLVGREDVKRYYRQEVSILYNGAMFKFSFDISVTLFLDGLPNADGEYPQDKQYNDLFDSLKKLFCEYTLVKKEINTQDGFLRYLIIFYSKLP